MQSLVSFFSWLGDTPWSSGLHESQYAYSIIESVHVWTLAVFLGSVVLGEPLGWHLLAGGALVLIAAAIANGVGAARLETQPSAP